MRGTRGEFRIGERGAAVPMLRLRPYKPGDAAALAGWFGEPRLLARWCAGRFAFPLDAAQLARYHQSCERDPGAWAMTALDPAGSPAGHFLLQQADYGAESVRLGLVAAAPELCRAGTCRELAGLALRYAFDMLRVRRVELRVFDSDVSLHRCFQAAGFFDECYRPGAYRYEDESWGVFEMAAAR